MQNILKSDLPCNGILSPSNIIIGELAFDSDCISLAAETVSRHSSSNGPIHGLSHFHEPRVITFLTYTHHRPEFISTYYEMRAEDGNISGNLFNIMLITFTTWFVTKVLPE